MKQFDVIIGGKTVVLSTTDGLDIVVRICVLDERLRYHASISVDITGNEERDTAEFLRQVRVVNFTPCEC